jgi:uncharacterized ferritin-like protein (DUF455 family)
MSALKSLHQQAFQALMVETIEQKSALIDQMQRATYLLDQTDPGKQDLQHIQDVEQPGQPPHLEFVHPRALKRRRLTSEEGRACFLHAIAHIEFNAVNLALDAAYRFRGMPGAFYDDWLRVAGEEVRHHDLLLERMQALGYEYGDFPVHDGLWEVARKTSYSLLSRMALVPCVLEARGLDVTPPMIQKLFKVGDADSAYILQIILDEEVDHVAIGVRWFNFACRGEGVDPVDCFTEMVKVHLPNRIQAPVNKTQRLAAGFTAEWLERLTLLSTGDFH